MFFPIPTDLTGTSASRVHPVINPVLIAINVVLYALGFSVNWGVSPHGSFLTIITYAFVHADVFHLLANMWVLWVFGNPVNLRIGNLPYLTCFLGITISLGVLGRLFSSEILVGSSGTIFGVVAISSLLLPATMIRIQYVAIIPATLLIGLIKKPEHWLGWLLRWDHFFLRTLFAIVILPVMELFGLWRWSSNGHLNWTNLGHLIGFVLGVAAVLILPDEISLKSSSGIDSLKNAGIESNT